MPEKYAFKMQLNPGMKAEYKKRHDEIWPELVVLLQRGRRLGLFDPSRRRDQHPVRRAVAHATTTAMDDLPKHPVMQRWWAHMADIMETKPDNEPVAMPLETVFHMA